MKHFGPFFVLAWLLAAATASPALSHEEPAEPVGDLMASMGIARIEEEIDAPDFTLSDLGGNPVRLSDHRGKVVLISFWTTW